MEKLGKPISQEYVAITSRNTYEDAGALVTRKYQEAPYNGVIGREILLESAGKLGNSVNFQSSWGITRQRPQLPPLFFLFLPRRVEALEIS